MESYERVIRVVGEPRHFSFRPRNHIELGKINDAIDIERAEKTSGKRFYFLKGIGALLELALINFSFKLLVKEDFIPLIPPVIVNERIVAGSGWFPSKKWDLFRVAHRHQFLVTTSEISILGLHTNEILEEKSLPLRYVAFSTCFRREAKAYYKNRKGIIRTHQFDKVEMFSFCRPDQSDSELRYFLSMQEEIMQTLEIPYRVVERVGGKIGASTVNGYDVEGWFPGLNRYRETHSCTNCKDIQSRKLNIRFRTKSGELKFVHTVNGTGVAVGRMVIALFENHQKMDGTISIPPALKIFMLE